MSRLDNPEIHSRIEKLRTDLGMTQPEFAAALGMDPKKGRSTINNWETRANKVKDDDLKKIATTFGVSADWLLGLHNIKSPKMEMQAVCKYTGLSEETVQLLRFSKSAPRTLNYLAKREKENDLPTNTPLFKFSSAFVKAEQAATLAAITALSDDPERRSIDASMKQRDLELAVFHFEKTCREILQSVFYTDALLDELSKIAQELYTEELKAFIEQQDSRKEAADGEHTED